MEIKNCEDDISTAEAYGRDEMLNERHSHGKASKTQRTKIKEVRYADKDYYIQSRQLESSSEVSIDDYLEEALDDQDDDDDDNTQSEDEEEEKHDSHLSKGSLGTTASHSFSFRKTPTTIYKTIDAKSNNDNFQAPTTTRGTEVNVNNLSSGGSYMQPVKSNLSVSKEDADMVTLAHASASSTSTPIRKICREQQVPQFHNYNEDSEYTDGDSTQSDEEMDDTHLVQEKIEKLLDEVCKQQQVIAQASQALNLCAATVEFSGSTESVEAERHLLVATHRRQACLDEVQRLRVEKVLRPLGAPRDKGRLTVKEITLPLRKSYIQQLSSDAISGHHLVCLMKYNEHVLATKSVSTLPGLLAVKFPDVLRLNDVYADFKVTIEIYGMTAQREILPHEVKYHINLNKKGGIKTPKKKARDNGLVMPPVQPVHVMGVCPLEGVLHMKVNCELSVSVEYEGFLNMYEDVSGYGAWHRRYCRLSGTVVNYWKYPDDVKEKAPIGSIDLYSCVTQKVEVAPRDICARLNTMLLQCERPALANDVQSLTIIPKGRNTIVRYLMSADSKDERIAWCAHFNKALALLRAWGPPVQYLKWLQMKPSKLYLDNGRDCPTEVSNSHPSVITAALLDDALGQGYGIAKRLVTVTLATLGATGYFGVHQMLEKAEKRRRALGVGSVVDISSCLAEVSSNVQSDVCAETMAVAADLQQKKQQKQKKQLYTAIRSDSDANVNVNRLQVIEKESNETNVAGIRGSPNADCTSKKILRQFAAVDKENMDLGIEINIMTDKHVEVQVQVEEQDMTTTDEEQTLEAQVRTTSKQADGAQQQRERIDQTSISALKNRNTPRKCLQRLGVLYSNTGDLSSPIHRTEGQFHADTDEGKETACTKPKRKLNKLVALADSINQWEDDITHHNIKASGKSSSIPPPKPDLPSRGRMKSIAPDSTTANEQIDNTRKLKDKDDGKTKQLKWHPKVINSLEAQGFQRRESSTLKLAYEFAKEQQELQEDIQEKPLNIDREKEARTECDKVNINKFAKQSYEEKKLNQPAENKKMATVKPGLVSGRTALFETQTQNVQKPQKDPTELSLKERMKFFEKNKGEALIPKAPFGMAAPISKLLQDSQKGKDEQAKVGAVSSSNLLLNKCNTERNVRAKVAALIQASNENKIKDDIRKQREEDMQVLSNRFNKQKELTEIQGVIGQQRQQEQGESQVKATSGALVTGKKAIVRPQALPPTPPPLPTSKNAPTPYAKRRSSDDAIDDDKKRARKSDRQLLSAGLSNFDSNESFSDNENNYCTTATASALNTADEMKESRQPLNRRDQRRNQLQQEEFEDREE
uniref:PH domain-containing protein n=1 Tax=Glossina morsitans morsitans TaxID=37546 RepID=A0A1B0FC10_GLOMM